MIRPGALWAWFAAALAVGACDGGDRSAVAADTRPQAAMARAAAPAPPTMRFPELTGRVVDQADLLRPEVEARLNEALVALERRTTDQLVIVTVHSLGGESIEQYSRSLGNHWRIGQADKDNGVLLVVAPQERRVRIEVGYGLEPILTNARAAEIIERDILPAFRDQDWDRGVTAGASAIIQTLTERAAEPRRGR